MTDNKYTIIYLITNEEKINNLKINIKYFYNYDKEIVSSIENSYRELIYKKCFEKVNFGHYNSYIQVKEAYDNFVEKTTIVPINMFDVIQKKKLSEYSSLEDISQILNNILKKVDKNYLINYSLFDIHEIDEIEEEQVGDGENNDNILKNIKNKLLKCMYTNEVIIMVDNYNYQQDIEQILEKNKINFLINIEVDKDFKKPIELVIKKYKSITA